jgi:hypothetical protein
MEGIKVLQVALAEATRQGVSAYGQIVAGEPSKVITDFAVSRRAKGLVVGSRRSASIRASPGHCASPSRAGTLAITCGGLRDRLRLD